MIADLWVYELGDVMLLTLLDRTRRTTVLARLDQFIFSEDVQLGDVTETFAQRRRSSGPMRRAVVAAVLRAGSRRPSCRRFAEHGNLRGTVRRSAGDRAARRRLRGAGIRPLRRSRRASTRSGAALRAAGAVEARRRRGRGAAHRGAACPVSPGHGRGDDSARGRHRGAGDQPDEGLLRRAGSDHPRAAPRPRPRGAEAGRPASTGPACRTIRCRRAGTPAIMPIAGRRARDRPA